MSRLYVNWGEVIWKSKTPVEYKNSLEELNNKEQQWRKEHRKELQQSLNKLKSTILQEKSNDNK